MDPGLNGQGCGARGARRRRSNEPDDDAEGDQRGCDRDPTVEEPPPWFGRRRRTPWCGTRVVVVVGACVVVVVGAVGVAGAAKATTWSAVGTRKRPAPTDGVGKWLAGIPTVAWAWTEPEAGSRP